MYSKPERSKSFQAHAYCRKEILQEAHLDDYIVSRIVSEE